MWLDKSNCFDLIAIGIDLKPMFLRKFAPKRLDYNENWGFVDYYVTHSSLFLLSF